MYSLLLLHYIVFLVTTCKYSKLDGMPELTTVTAGNVTAGNVIKYNHYSFIRCLCTNYDQAAFNPHNIFFLKLFHYLFNRDTGVLHTHANNRILLFAYFNNVQLKKKTDRASHQMDMTRNTLGTCIAINNNHTIHQ